MKLLAMTTTLESSLANLQRWFCGWFEKLGYETKVDVVGVCVGFVRCLLTTKEIYETIEGGGFDAMLKML